MALFEGIGKKVSQASQGAVKNTKVLAEVARLNGLIADEEKVANSFYLQLGMKYHQCFGEVPDAALLGLCEAIKESGAKLQGWQGDIDRLKGLKTCQGCGQSIAQDAQFCGNCGRDTSLDELQIMQRQCPNCQQVIANEVAFCTHCGQKL